jgi:hypothetical protein
MKILNNSQKKWKLLVIGNLMALDRAATGTGYWITLRQWFPTSFQLRTPRQPITTNCTLHISKMFVINMAAVILNLYIVTVNK